MTPGVIPDEMTLHADRLAAILTLTLQGFSPERIGRTYGLSAARVCLVRNAHGWPHANRLRDQIAQLQRLGHLEVTFLTLDDQDGTLDRLHTRRAGNTPEPPALATPGELVTDPAAGEGPARTQLVEVSVDDIDPDPDNPRENLTGIDELADSITTVGLLQPIVVRRHAGRLMVIAGHRRLAAIRHLGWTTLQVIIHATMRPDDVLAAMLVENGQRAGLDPIEEARALARLKAQTGLGPIALGARIGRSQSYVSGRLALLALPIEDQEAVRAGTLNVGDGIRRGRLAAGKVRPAGVTGSPHLGVDHDLAPLAKARCARLKHNRRGRNSVGGTACGQCWESVIRADEREHLHTASATAGHCLLCNHTLQETS